MALVEEVAAAAAQVGLENVLGGWMMFGDRSVAAVDESHKIQNEKSVIKRFKGANS